MAGRLIRKQFLISPEQEAKLARLSADQKVSAGELVRRAIDAYDEAGDESQLTQALEGASAMVRESLAVLERSGERLREACRRLDDPGRRQAVQTAVRAELNKDPPALDRLRATAWSGWTTGCWCWRLLWRRPWVDRCPRRGGRDGAVLECNSC